VLFALVHGPLCLAESLHGQEPPTVSFLLAEAAGIAGLQEIAVCRVEVVIDHLSLARGPEGVTAQGAQIEQRIEHGGVGYGIFGFDFHGE
jgi:hypothetical protein